MSSQKIWHLIQSRREPLTAIFINHSGTAGIVAQIKLITVNTDKLNLRLVRVSQFLSTMSIQIKVKPGKFHRVPDALSRLAYCSSTQPENATLADLDDSMETFFARARISTHS